MLLVAKARHPSIIEGMCTQLMANISLLESTNAEQDRYSYYHNQMEYWVFKITC